MTQHVEETRTFSLFHSSVPPICGASHLPGSRTHTPYAFPEGSTMLRPYRTHALLSLPSLLRLINPNTYTVRRLLESKIEKIPQLCATHTHGKQQPITGWIDGDLESMLPTQPTTGPVTEQSREIDRSSSESVPNRSHQC